MDKKGFYTDYVRRFYTDDSDGACLTVQNDGDGLGMVHVETVSMKDQEWFGKVDFSMDPVTMRGFAELLIAASYAIEELEST